MFDQNDQNQQAVSAPVVPEPAVSSGITTPVADVTAPTTTTVDPIAAPSAPEPVTPTTDAPAADPISFNTTPVDSPAPEATTAPEPVSTDVTAPAVTTAGSDDLLSIKQDALQSLSPLLSHLDQTPEEKFRTTMMLIQASDDQSLIQAAYAAAKDITDEKVRAQALLDIVNEINYFTQHKATDAPAAA